MIKRVHIFYSGQVQGVGFRYTTHNLATELNTASRSPERRITGWVRNLRDGRVELVAESEAETLRELLARIKQKFGSSIQRADEEWSDGTGEFVDFTIATTA